MQLKVSNQVILPKVRECLQSLGLLTWEAITWEGLCERSENQSYEQYLHGSGWNIANFEGVADEVDLPER